MKRMMATALVLGALGATLAACGDTRSNKELGGVATWPAGGSAHGSWAERNPAPATTYYGSSSDTVTTTTYPPRYYAEPRPYPPPSYAPPAYYAPPPYPPPPYPPAGYR